MNGVDKAGDPYASIGLATKPAGSKSGSEQDQFLQLMVAQLKNQDPFQPMENGEFLSQIAQFSTVTGIQELQKSFESIAASMQSNQALQASSMVGRSVMVPHDVGYLDDDGLKGAVALNADANRVVISVQDRSGQLVSKFDLGPQEAGMVNFKWDGYGIGGMKLPEGTYRVSAESWLGTHTEALQIYTSSPVESVTIGRGGSGMMLNLTGLGAWNINDVRQIL